MAFSIPFNYTVGTSANNLVQLTAAAKLPAVDGSLLTNLPGSSFSPTITSPASGQVVRYNGSSWVNAAIAAGDLPSGIDVTKIGTGVEVVPLVCSTLSANTDYTGTSDAFTVEPASLTVTVPSTGKYQGSLLVNCYLTGTGITTQVRLAMGTAVIAGSTGYPVGFAFAQGASGTSNATITTGSPTIVNLTSKSSGTQHLVLYATFTLNVTTAGTIKTQIAIAGTTANVLKLLETSTIKLVKLV